MQHDYDLINQSGASFRADLNNALSAIATNNAGASSPSTTFAYEWWIDESNGVLKIRNSANSAWITTGLNLTTNNLFTGDITGNAPTATILANTRTINGVAFNGSANISFNSDSVSEGSSNLYFTNERVDDQVNALLQAGTGIQLSYDDTAGTLTIANTNDADITSVVAGNALSGGGTSGAVTLNVAVDDSSIEIDSDALRVKASGITNTMLAGSIANNKLANSSVTINSQSLALGGSLNLDTSEIPENTNLYYTDARFDTRLATKDTDNLGEGTNNLYYTNERVDDRVATLIQNGTGISFTYDDTNATLTPVITLSPFDTSNLSESGNLYYTDARARAAISENSAQLSYDSGTGVLTYTQGDTDTVAEGTNLYYTDARANTAIDARVTNTFINNLSGVVADTTTALATARSIALSGDVVGTVSFDGTSDVTISSTIQANSVALSTDTTGDYVQTITGTNNKITVSGSGTEGRDVTLTLPSDVQIANDLTVAGNLTVNGTLTSLDTTNLDIEDNLFQLNAGLTGLPVNDSGMLINRGNQNNGIFMWDESVDKFTMGLTTADGSSTGNITLASLGTLVANLEGSVIGNVTGQVSDISNFTTANLTENTNLYYTQTRFDTAFTAKSTSDLSEGSNLYYTDARFDTRLASKDTDDVSEGTSNLYYTSARFNSAFSGKSTSDLSEGTNLYYTDARVQAVSINNVVEDTSPQLGGNLDLNSSDITGTGDINITGTITSSGNITGTLATAAQPNITSVGTLTGLTTTGDINLGDDDKAIFGAGSDLQIYHDGSNSYVNEQGTGSLYLNTTNGAGVFLTSAGENLAQFNSNGAVTLYHDNSAKLATASGGVTVTGTLVSDSLTVDTTTLVVDASNNRVGIGTSSPLATLDVVRGGTTGLSSVNARTALLVQNNLSNGTVLSINAKNTGYSGIFFGDQDAEAKGQLQYDHTDDKFKFFTNGGGQNPLTLDSSGNVGIGTSSPTHTLHVQGTSNDTIDETKGTMKVQASGGNGMILGTIASSPYTSYIQSAYVQDTSVAQYNLALNPIGGNVGIGETSPLGKLHVKTADSGASVDANADELVLENSGSSGISILSGTTGDGNLFFGDSGGSVQGKLSYSHNGDYLSLLSTGASIFYNGGSERMRIDSSGNVGIGITSLNEGKLHVKSDSSGEVELLTLENSTGTNGKTTLTFKTTSTDATKSAQIFAERVNASGHTDLAFRTFNGSTAERMRIGSNGQVTIATTAWRNDFYLGMPITTSVSGIATQNAASSGTHYAAAFYNSSNSTIGTITTTNTATAYNTSSDARLKDVTGEARGLEVINELNPVAYNWKADGQADEGLIAQEVMEIVPNAVSGSEEEMYQMDYSKLVTPLIKAIQEQQEQIDKLSKEIVKLKKK